MVTHTPADRRRRRKEGPGRLLLAFLLALLAHVAFVGGIILLSYIQVNLPGGDKQLTRKPSAVAVRPLTADQWAKNRGESKPSKSQTTERPRLEEKKEEKKDRKRPDGQVVDVQRGNEQEAPDAKYIAERDNKVAKETKAREQTAHYRNAMPQQTAPQSRQGDGQQAVEQPQVAGNNGLGQDELPMSGGETKPRFELPDARKKQEIALKTDPSSPGPGMEVNNRNESDEIAGNSKRLRVNNGTGADENQGSMGRVGLPGVATLMPSQAVMDKLIGAAPNDHLRDVDEGEGTLLNTREWKYASFFNRVKQSVGMYWNPNSLLRRRDPTGAIYSGKDRYTLVNVTLNERGLVEDIRVEKSSGLDFLDLEAVDSFQRAQPFPNPPPGLLEDDSKVRFSFGFFLEMGGGPRMRLFRQSN
ncbi:energy transducer TonB [Hyalangium rubrum]|uniref:Energy transducer TonB n=1 Tax=Hyalangium rubrum TaxID=3103134 RepID=A0ABU5GV46_9BACT|nr:energy transducer TonB [Hyalangium sp. s54d21]MDY7224739.1 energy transducer TonB [Hyalangium sp. s54d21]